MLIPKTEWFSVCETISDECFTRIPRLPFDGDGILFRASCVCGGGVWRVCLSDAVAETKRMIASGCVLVGVEWKIAGRVEYSRMVDSLNRRLKKDV